MLLQIRQCRLVLGFEFFKLLVIANSVLAAEEGAQLGGVGVEELSVPKVDAALVAQGDQRVRHRWEASRCGMCSQHGCVWICIHAYIHTRLSSASEMACEPSPRE